MTEQWNTPREELRQKAAWTARVEVAGLLVRTLQARGIRALIWKGLDHALAFWDPPWSRSMGDLDFLVPRNRLGTCLSAGRREGFSRTDALEEGLALSGIVGECKLRKAGVLVELHVHPLYFPCFLPGRLQEPEGMPPRSIPELGLDALDWPEDLLYCALGLLPGGGTADQRRELAWIGERITGPGWDRFAAVAAATGWASSLGRLLRVCEVPAPGRIFRFLGEVPDRSRVPPASHRGRSSLNALLRLTGWRRWSFGAILLLRSTGIRWGSCPRTER